MPDIILSSGYLGFARHIGFLKAIEEKGISVDAVCGTSSGAIVGALYCAGYSLNSIAELIAEKPPIKHIKLNGKFWQGIFSLSPFTEFLATKLPDTFEQLDRPFAVGVCRYKDHCYHLLYKGDLPSAVTASGAIPRIFAPIKVSNELMVDAAVVDRLGLEAWQAFRPNKQIIIHNIESSQKRLTRDKAIKIQFPMVETPKTQASLRGLKHFRAEILEAYELAGKQLEQINKDRSVMNNE